jgi:hypothetical protein
MVGKNLSNQTVQTSPFVKVFNCSHCGSSIKISALGMSVMAVCSSCGTVVDTKDENFKVITQFIQKCSFEPIIKIGTRGKLHGSLWEVIGFLERSDTHKFYWHEYLLFNPQKGFRWLTVNSGHWSWVVSVKDKPIDDGAAAYYRNRTYDLFHTGKARNTYVIGELYWRANVNETTKVSDFIRAPEILSIEKSVNEIHWSLGEYIEAETVKNAFKLDSIPSPQGVAPNQLWGNTKAFDGIKSYWLIMMGIVFLLQFKNMVSSEDKIVFSVQREHKEDFASGSRPLLTSPFELKDKVGNLELYLKTNLSNKWLELQVELVNDDTGESKEIEFGAEYYHGYSGGESWSEGSQSASFFIPAIPAGNYHINYTTSSEYQNTVNYDFSGKRDVLIWSDFFWACGLISIFPIFMVWRRRSFEVRRWENSDYSPYHGAEDND